MTSLWLLTFAAAAVLVVMAVYLRALARVLAADGYQGRAHAPGSPRDHFDPSLAGEFER